MFMFMYMQDEDALAPVHALRRVLIKFLENGTITAKAKTKGGDAAKAAVDDKASGKAGKDGGKKRPAATIADDGARSEAARKLLDSFVSLLLEGVASANQVTKVCVCDRNLLSWLCRMPSVWRYG